LICLAELWGHPLKGTCQEKKVVRKQEEAFFLRRRCGCENGPFFSSSEQPPPYRLFCSRSNLLPTLHGSLRFSLTERSSLSSHPPLSHCRSFFRFIGVRLNGTSHPSGSRSAVKLVFLCDPCPLLRTQKIFGSRPCPIRRLQISWLLANPWGLTAWAVKTLMTYKGRGGTVDQSDFVVFHQPHSGFSVPAQILTQIIFLDEKPLDPS